MALVTFRVLLWLPLARQEGQAGVGAFASMPTLLPILPSWRRQPTKHPLASPPASNLPVVTQAVGGLFFKQHRVCRSEHPLLCLLFLYLKHIFLYVQIYDGLLYVLLTICSVLWWAL